MSLGAALRAHGTTAALVVIAASATAALLIVDRGSISTDEKTARKRQILPSFRGEDVTAVSVTAKGRSGKLVRGAVDDAGQRPWSIEMDGASLPVEEPAVDQLLASLRDGTAERRIAPDAVSLGAFGLDPPRAAIEIDMGAQRYRLLLGGPAPTPAGAVYAAVVGHGAMVITAQLAAALDVSPDALRSRALLPYSPGDLATLALDGEGGPRHLERAAWGGGARPDGGAIVKGGRGAGFRFDGSTEEGTVRVSAPGLEKIWGAFARLEAEAFLTDADADRAARKVITLSLGPRDPGKPRAVIELGGACPGRPDDVVAIRREPSRISACVPESALDALSMPAAELVDRRLVGAPLDEVTEVKQASGGRTIELARTKSGWHLRVPEDRAIDAAVGRGFLEALLAIEAGAIAPGDAKRDPASIGLDSPRATVRIVSVVPAGPIPDAGDADRVETIEVGKEQAGSVWVRRVEDGAIAKIPADRAAPLFASELALRARKIFDEPIASFRALRIEAHGRVQRFERTDEGGFRLVEPKGAGLAADSGLASSVAEILGGLTVERWIGAPAKEHGLDAPRLVIEADLGGRDAGARTIRVALGAPADEGSFARRDGDPAVFVAPRALEAAADRWLLDRAAMLVEPAQVTRATLTGERGKRLVIEQIAGVFQIAGAPRDPATQARAAAVRDALGELLAEVAVSVGPPEKREGLDKPRLTLVVERQGGAPPVKIAIGAGDTLHGTSVYYARREGVDATYAIAQARILPLLEAVEGKR